MIPTALEKALLEQTRKLPEESVQQLINFAQFLQQKQAAATKDDIATELTTLSFAQVAHLEEEFENYQQIYPCEHE